MTRARGIAALSGAIFLVILVVGTTAALAAKPDRAPLLPDPAVLEPGQACAFSVEIASLPGSNYTETIFADGRRMITGSGRERVTNLSPGGGSVTVPTSGKVTETELAGGDLRIAVSGRTILFFFAGDQGPFGEVGADGALYLLKGHADQVLDGETGLITSIEWGGQVTELCSQVD